MISIRMEAGEPDEALRVARPRQEPAEARVDIAPASGDVRRFVSIMMPHLDAAYDLARWLTRSDTDAEDVVQEAYLRAFRFFAGFEGRHPRAWLLRIVYNTACTWLRSNRRVGDVLAIEESLEEIDRDPNSMLINSNGLGRDPEKRLIESRDKERLDKLIAGLPAIYREVIVLRLIEEMSYQEISEILGVPIGTVMSRLARGRGFLQSAWEAGKGLATPKRERRRVEA